MVIFNLLPWREHEYQYHKRKWRLIFTLSLSATLFTLFIWYALLIKDVTALEHYVETLNVSLLTYKKNIRENQSDDQQYKLLDHVRTYHAANSRLLKAMHQPLISGICFTEISRHQSTLTYKGHAASVALFTDFIKDWRASALFTEIKIDHLQQEGDQIIFHFRAEEKEMFHDAN